MNLIKFSSRYTVASLLLNPFYSSFLPKEVTLKELGLINTYLFYGLPEKDNNETSCFMVFDALFINDHILNLKCSSYYVDSFDVDDKYVLEMRLPIPNMKRIILSGNYSLLKEEKYHELLNKNSIGYKIIVKDPILRLGWQRVEEDLDCNVLTNKESYPLPLKRDETYLTSIKQRELV